VGGRKDSPYHQIAMRVGSQLRASKVGRVVTCSQASTPRSMAEAEDSGIAMGRNEQSSAPSSNTADSNSAISLQGASGCVCRQDLNLETNCRRYSVGTTLLRWKTRVGNGWKFSSDSSASEKNAGMFKAADKHHVSCDALEHARQRLNVWPELFGNPESAVAFDESSELELPAAVTSQIQQDVVRTQPQHFAETECEFLRTVLSCFVVHNPDVGYCQGLNFIVSVFLRLSFDVATTLRGLTHMLATCCSGYHGPDLHGYRRDVNVMHELSRQVLDEPALRRIDGLGLPLDILALDHFLTLTSRSWPFEATVRLWDILLLKGAPALFASFLAVLEMYAPPLPEQVTDDHEPVHDFQQAMLLGLRSDFDAIMTRTWELMEFMPQAKIEHLREAVDSSNFRRTAVAKTTPSDIFIDSASTACRCV